MLGLRRSSNLIGAASLIGGPTVLAFFAGGYFNEPRLVAGAIAWLLVALAALTAERPLPRHAPGRLALGGLLLLLAWTALSLTWAPLGDPAIADVQRVALYCAFLIAAAAWLGTKPAIRAVEPGLALGMVLVVGYGMLERYLPGAFELKRSALAFGRLEQPLTYWNGMGLLAAFGLVLSARLAGSSARPAWLRSAAAAAAPLLGGALLLTLSRGALAAAAVGLFVVLVLAREPGQPRSVALVAAAAGLAAALAAALPGLDALGVDASRTSGAVLLGGTLLLAAAAGLGQRRLSAAADGEGPQRARREGRSRWRAVAVVAIGLVGLAAAVATHDSSGGAGGNEPAQGAERLRSLDSPRFRYWEVAGGAFSANPVRGLGSAGYRVEWAREAGRESRAQEAHSLYVETAAELGLVGLLLLGTFLAGLAASAPRALASQRAAAVGPVAVLCAWAFHAGIDWDWELPGVTLPALACAGMLVALGDREPEDRPSISSAARAPESAGAPPKRAADPASPA